MKKKIKNNKKGEEYYRHTATDAYDEAINYALDREDALINGREAPDISPPSENYPYGGNLERVDIEDEFEMTHGRKRM